MHHILVFVHPKFVWRMVSIVKIHLIHTFGSQDGVTPLYRACEKGQKEVVKVLLEHKADVVKPCSKVRIRAITEKTLLMGAEASLH